MAPFKERDLWDEDAPYYPDIKHIKETDPEDAYNVLNNRLWSTSWSLNVTCTGDYEPGLSLGAVWRGLRQAGGAVHASGCILLDDNWEDNPLNLYAWVSERVSE